MSAVGSRTYNLPYTNVIWEVEQAMVACRFNLEIVDQQRGYLKATTGLSMGSYGETVEVSVGRAGAGVTVHAESRPSHYFTDMGKSRTNVNQLLNYLDARMAGYIVQGDGGPPQATLASGGGPSLVVRTTEPSRTMPILLSMASALVAVLVSIFYMAAFLLLGLFVLVFSILGILGAVLMTADKWKVGAVLAIICGVVTIPIGLLGIVGGSMAWQYGKWQAASKSP